MLVIWIIDFQFIVYTLIQISFIDLKSNVQELQQFHIFDIDSVYYTHFISVSIKWIE